MRVRAATLVLLVCTALACNDTPSSPRPIGGTGSAAVDVAGTWSGSAADSTRQMSMTWRVTQSGGNITGTFTAVTPVGAPIYTAGAITGTASATAVTFTIAVPRGAVDGAPDCSATFAGTAEDVRPDSMAGTYEGSDTCGGTFAGGRFTLLRQPPGG